MKNIQELEAERLEWSLKNFPDATPKSSIMKLREESKEVLKEISRLEKFPDGDEGLADLTEEYADCLMCLFDSAGRAGVSPDEIFEAFAEKLEINKSRVWKKNPDNTYSHVKQ
jgi:NTP pyrophosphatase (non-canonical NTP hydrolase)